MSLFALEAGGKEQGDYLNYKLGYISLRPTIEEEGTMFKLINAGENKVHLACTGDEKGKYLSHSSDTVSIRVLDKPTSDETWYIQHLTDKFTEGYIAFRTSKTSESYLSHTTAAIELIKYQEVSEIGEGEMWSMQNLIKTLNDKDFVQQTANWAMLEGASSDEFYFFKRPKLLLGAKLYSNAVELLLSRTSVETIKVRFGLEKREGGHKFNVILFGTDNVGEVLTPYYVAETQTDQPHIELSSIQGNVPTIFFHIWRNYWLARDQKRNPVDCKLFTSHYGFLKGYNYTAKEFYSLFNTATTGVIPNVLIRFVLHKFKLIKEDTNINNGYTFGIVFQSDYNFYQASHSHNSALTDTDVSSRMSYLDSSGDDSSVFYDISMPCPRTC